MAEGSSMAFSELTQPTRRRGRAKSLTKTEVEAARNRLRDAAAAGDLQACAALVALADNRAAAVDHEQISRL
jgi:hypothetical protein